MIIFLFPRYFIVLSWILGTSPPLLLPTLGLIGIGGLLVLFLRRYHNERSVALLGIFGLMLLDSLLLVAFTVLFRIMGPPPHLATGPAGHLVEHSNRALDMFHDLSFALSLLGIAGAGVASVVIGFGKSRISLAKAFPHVTFLEATTELNQMVYRLAERAGIKSPDLCLVDSGSPSAFTVRANGKYSIAVSVGLLESLEGSEVEACLAHEIAHLKNNDFRMRFLATVAKVALFARPLSYFLEPAVYRSREFLADASATKLVGGPDALISAISKLKESTELESTLPSSTCVCNLHSRNGLFRIFDKHPSLEARLVTLREMKQP